MREKRKITQSARGSHGCERFAFWSLELWKFLCFVIYVYSDIYVLFVRIYIYALLFEEGHTLKMEAFNKVESTIFRSAVSTSFFFVFLLLLSSFPSCRDRFLWGCVCALSALIVCALFLRFFAFIYLVRLPPMKFPLVTGSYDLVFPSLWTLCLWLFCTELCLTYFNPKKLELFCGCCFCKYLFLSMLLPRSNSNLQTTVLRIFELGCCCY